MNKLTDKRKVSALIWLCTLAYFISYVSRINLSAALVEVANSGFAAKTTAALALTVCSVTYGAGQIISGYLGDRCKPQNLIRTGFVITACTNLCVGFLQQDVWLVPLWGINGFAQALMWPPMVTILSFRLSAEDYQIACVRVSWGSSFGTIAVYLLAPVLISVLNVRWVFLSSAIAAFIMLIVWKVSFEHSFGSVETAGGQGRQAEAVPAARLNRSALLLIGAVITAIILQGFLRDGVTNWTPSYVSDIFRVDSSAAILSGVILPVFSILCFQLSHIIHRRWLKNEMVCAAAFFLSGCLAAIALAVLDGQNMILSLVSLALLVGSMHGVNLMLISMVPHYFGKYGRVSLVSGVLNAGTYIGSALSAYGTAVYTELFGWQSTILLWAVTALAGAALCLCLKRKWHRFKQLA